MLEAMKIQRMGKLKKNTSMAADESQKQERGDR